MQKSSKNSHNLQLQNSILDYYADSLFLMQDIIYQMKDYVTDLFESTDYPFSIYCIFPRSKLIYGSDEEIMLAFDNLYELFVTTIREKGFNRIARICELPQFTESKICFLSHPYYLDLLIKCDFNLKNLINIFDYDSSIKNMLLEFN